MYPLLENFTTCITITQPQIDSKSALQDHTYKYPNWKVELLFAEKAKLVAINMEQRKRIRSLEVKLMAAQTKYDDLSNGCTYRVLSFRLFMNFQYQLIKTCAHMQYFFGTRFLRDIYETFMGPSI